MAIYIVKKQSLTTVCCGRKVALPQQLFLGILKMISVHLIPITDTFEMDLVHQLNIIWKNLLSGKNFASYLAEAERCVSFCPTPHLAWLDARYLVLVTGLEPQYLTGADLIPQTRDETHPPGTGEHGARIEWEPCLVLFFQFGISNPPRAPGPLVAEMKARSLAHTGCVERF